VDLRVTALERDVAEARRVGEPAGPLDRQCGGVHAQRTAVAGCDG
jgi:hypothetical protein